MPDLAGLNQLDRRRQAAASRAKRQVPPAKHPKATVERDAASSAVGEDDQEARVVDVREQPAAQVPDLAVAPNRPRSRVRPTQVHLDDASEEHLTTLKKRSVMADVPLTSSAVLRMALAELVERYGYDRIVEMFAADASQPRPGRPRR